MKKDRFSSFKSLIKGSRSIVIVTHWSPDGDAMGSSLGLYHYLKGEGKKVQVIVPNAYPEFLKWLPGDKGVMVFQNQEEKAARILKKSDLIFTLDFNTLKRLEKLGELIAALPAKKVMIDHHQQPDNYAHLYFYDVKACSTCELIYDLIVGLGGRKKINRKIAECLYTGIMTDTGSFRYRGVNPNTHLIVSELIKTGIVPADIHEHVYDTYSEQRLKLVGFALSEKMRLLPGNKIAYISLSEEELNRFRYKKGDTEGLVNYPFSIEGVKVCAFFNESASDGFIKLSFRSKGKIDVNKFARQHFNGGGHINAAGGKSFASLTDTIAKFEQLAPELLK